MWYTKNTHRIHKSVFEEENEMKKIKIIALLIVVVQLLSLISCEMVTNLMGYRKTEYVLSPDGTFAVAVRGATEKNIKIADTYQGVPVKAIVGNQMDWYYDKAIKVEIPSSVVYIDPITLNSCENLQSIVVDSNNPIYYSEGNCLIQRDPTTVDSKDLFEQGCTIASIVEKSDGRITSVTYFFDGYLKGEVLLVGCNSSVIPQGVTSIGDSAFLRRESLTNIEIPNSVTSIGSSAFGGCISLKTVKMPESVTYIGSGAFGECTSLTSITLPKRITTIERGTFGGCSSLTTLEIPNSVTSIGMSAFSGCDKLIQIENGVSYVDKWAVKYDGIVKNVVLRDNTVGLGFEVFYGFDNLETITIPKGLKHFPENSFFSCNNLSHVYITDAEAWLNLPNFDFGTPGGFYAYPNRGDAQLHILDENGDEVFDLIIPDNLNYIRDGAFYNCTNLRSVTIPSNVITIGDAAFCNCSSLAEITLEHGITSIGDSAFDNCDALTSIVIPKSVTKIGSHAFSGCDTLERIVFDGTIAEWNLIEKGSWWGDTTVYCTDGSITQLGTITYYEEVARGLVFILNPDGRTFSVTDIGTCTDTDIYIPDTYKGFPVTGIADYAFSNSTDLMTVSIGTHVASIGDFAFYGCKKLTSVSFDSSVVTIGKSAFQGCKSLNVIIFDGTVEEWYAIEKGTDWNKTTGLYTIHCENGHFLTRDKQ